LKVFVVIFRISGEKKKKNFLKKTRKVVPGISFQKKTLLITKKPQKTTSKNTASKQKKSEERVQMLKE